MELERQTTRGWTRFRWRACTPAEIILDWWSLSFRVCLSRRRYPWSVQLCSTDEVHFLKDNGMKVKQVTVLPFTAGRTDIQHKTAVAQSMGFPSCFIFSIRALICSRLMSFGCSIKRRIVGRWLVCPLPFTWSESTLCLSCEVAAQGEAPCSRLQVSVVSAGCPPCSPPEKHKSDYGFR